MRKRKGFTLVELVIVIAVIAILAGVFVGTFANIIKSANESAELLRAKSQIDEIKANDVLDEIDNSDWYSINDFEEDVAEKLYDYFYNKKLTEENLKEALQEAIYIYEDNLDNTNIHDDDLIVSIVNNSVNKPIFGGVTYYQVERLLINKWDDEIKNGDLKNADIKAISNNLVGKQLTAYDVAKLINECDDYNNLKNVNTNHKNNDYKFEFDFNLKPDEFESIIPGLNDEGEYVVIIENEDEFSSFLNKYNNINSCDDDELKMANKVIVHLKNDLENVHSNNKEYIEFVNNSIIKNVTIEGHNKCINNTKRGLAFTDFNTKTIYIKNLNINITDSINENVCGISVLGNLTTKVNFTIENCNINLNNNGSGLYITKINLDVRNNNYISNCKYGLNVGSNTCIITVDQDGFILFDNISTKIIYEEINSLSNCKLEENRIIAK